MSYNFFIEHKAWDSHRWGEETSELQFLPGKAALLIIPVREASSWRDPTLTSWHLRIAWIVSEWEIKNCKTCMTRKKGKIWTTQNWAERKPCFLLLENFKVISHISEDGILKKAYFQSKRTQFLWMSSSSDTLASFGTYLSCCLQVLCHAGCEDHLAQLKSWKKNLAITFHWSRNEDRGISHSIHS